jgi:hypothetical protein
MQGEPPMSRADVNTQEPLYWNFTKSAELLGSLSSILAAFAFGALVIMLATPPKDGTVDVAPAEQLMIGSFFSLIVASFLFAVQSGSGNAVRRYRPFVEGFCSCWILAVSTVELCACTAWLLSVYRVPASVLPIGNGIVLGAIGITSLSLTGVAMAPVPTHPRVPFDDPMARNQYASHRPVDSGGLVAFTFR